MTKNKFRLARLKRANLPLTKFFSFYPTPPTTTPPPTYRPTFPRTNGLSDVPTYAYPLLTPLPASYRPSSRRIRALDTDTGGRRLGSGGPNDHDGYITDKDILPAYDNVGGPPKYIELDTFNSAPDGINARTNSSAQSPDTGQIEQRGVQEPRTEATAAALVRMGTL